MRSYEYEIEKYESKKYGKYNIHICMKDCAGPEYPGMYIDDGIEIIATPVFYMDEEYHPEFMDILNSTLQKAINSIDINMKILIHEMNSKELCKMWMDDESILNCIMSEGYWEKL